MGHYTYVDQKLVHDFDLIFVTEPAFWIEDICVGPDERWVTMDHPRGEHQLSSAKGLAVG